LPTAVSRSIPTTAEATIGNAATSNGPTNPQTDGADEPRVGSPASSHSPAANGLVGVVATAILVNVGRIK
jgi:hypothetical protein